MCGTWSTNLPEQYRRKRDRINDVICFMGIDFVRACCRGVFGEEIGDQFDHHAMKAGAFFVNPVFRQRLVSQRTPDARDIVRL
jgi:hypothetical protein